MHPTARESMDWGVARWRRLRGNGTISDGRGIDLSGLDGEGSWLEWDGFGSRLQVVRNIYFRQVALDHRDKKLDLQSASDTRKVG